MAVAFNSQCEQQRKKIWNLSIKTCSELSLIVWISWKIVMICTPAYRPERPTLRVSGMNTCPAAANTVLVLFSAAESLTALAPSRCTCVTSWTSPKPAPAAGSVWTPTSRRPSASTCTWSLTPWCWWTTWAAPRLRCRSTSARSCVTASSWTAACSATSDDLWPSVLLPVHGLLRAARPQMTSDLLCLFDV